MEICDRKYIYPFFDLHFTFPLKICAIVRELGNKTYIFYYLYTLQFKEASALLYKRI